MWIASGSRGGPSGPAVQRRELAKLSRRRDVDCARERSPESGLPLLGTHLSIFSSEQRSTTHTPRSKEVLSPGSPRTPDTAQQRELPEFCNSGTQSLISNP